MFFLGDLFTFCGTNEHQTSIVMDMGGKDGGKGGFVKRRPCTIVHLLLKLTAQDSM
jgi:hypothetical protein